MGAVAYLSVFFKLPLLGKEYSIIQDLSEELTVFVSV